MENQLTVITERIDDVVLLLNVMMQIGLPELLNNHLERHWKQEGLDDCHLAGVHPFRRRPPEGGSSRVGP